MRRVRGGGLIAVESIRWGRRSPCDRDGKGHPRPELCFAAKHRHPAANGESPCAAPSGLGGSFGFGTQGCALGYIRSPLRGCRERRSVGRGCRTRPDGRMDSRSPFDVASEVGVRLLPRPLPAEGACLAEADPRLGPEGRQVIAPIVRSGFGVRARIGWRPGGPALRRCRWLHASCVGSSDLSIPFRWCCYPALTDRATTCRASGPVLTRARRCDRNRRTFAAPGPFRQKGPTATPPSAHQAWRQENALTIVGRVGFMVPPPCRIDGQGRSRTQDQPRQ